MRVRHPAPYGVRLAKNLNSNRLQYISCRSHNFPISSLSAGKPAARNREVLFLRSLVLSLSAASKSIEDDSRKLLYQNWPLVIIN